jgi:hypothetical protein
MYHLARANASPSPPLLTILFAFGDHATSVLISGFVPHRYQSGNFDYTGGSSKCGDRPTSLPYSSL